MRRMFAAGCAAPTGPQALAIRYGLRALHAAAPASESKESKSPPHERYTDRSSSLVWMTHSHCVRSNPAKVVGPNPTRSTTI